MREDLHVIEGSKPPETTRAPEPFTTVEDGFVELLARSLDDLFRFACRLEIDADRARDLLQEGILTAYRQCRQLERADSFRAWAARIVRRTFLNSLRKRREEPWPIAPEEGAQPSFSVRPLDPEERFLARERAAEVRAALDTLPREQREAVLLIDLLGFSYAEAATALDSPPGTVASRVARGRSGLRLRLRHLLQKGDRR